MIWDFRGPDALKIARHHEIHLKEYIAMEKFPIEITGFESLNEVYAIAFLVLTDAHLIAVRDALKPHRAEIYESGN